MKLNKKIIIIVIALILVIVISLFLVFRKEKYFIFYIDGINQDILNQYSQEDLPNLKSLYQSNLSSKISLNKKASFLTILSGRYRYASNYQKQVTEYIGKEEKNDSLSLFHQTSLYRKAQQKKIKVKFYNQTIDLNNIRSDIVVYRYQVNENNLTEYQKIDNLIQQIKESISFNTRLLVILPFNRKTLSSNEINKVLVNKGFLSCADNFQNLNKCNLANSFAYSPTDGEIYLNKKGREKLGKVDWDVQGVMEDTIYVLSSELGDNIQIYEGDNYFSQKNIPEILVFKNSSQERALILSNKKFVQNKYDYSKVLNMFGF